MRVLSVASKLCSVEMLVAGRDVAQDLIRDGFAIASSYPPQSTTKDHQKEALTIPPFSATVGSEMEVFVTFCDFPKVPYCQPSQLDDKFHQLTENIQDHCNSDSAVVLSVNDVSIGDVILAQYSEDMSCYRARVKETTKSSVVVLFVDFGNCKETKTLCEISADFCSLPTQAVPCTLLNWKDFAVAPESSGHINDHLTSDNSGFSLRFVEVSVTGEESVVQLTRLSDGLGVLQQACEAGLLVSKGGAPVGRYQGHKVVSTGTSLPPVVVETNSREDGFVSHLESPISFWVQFACNESELDSLVEQLAAVYGSAGDLTKLALSNPTTGQVCCAQFSNDMQWYRSVVESVRFSLWTLATAKKRKPSVKFQPIFARSPPRLSHAPYLTGRTLLWRLRAAVTSMTISLQTTASSLSGLCRCQ